MTAFNLDNVLAAVEGVRERYEREKNQAILKEAMGDARWAIAYAVGQGATMVSASPVVCF